MLGQGPHTFRFHEVLFANCFNVHSLGGCYRIAAYCSARYKAS